MGAGALVRAGGHAIGRPSGRLVALTGVLVAMAAALPGPAGAGAPGGGDDAPDSGVRLVVEPVFGTDHDSGEHVTVAVTIEADQLIEGTVTVQNADDASLALREDLEVAGSSTKRLLFVVPTRLFSGGGGQVEAQLEVDGTVVATDVVRLTHDPQATVVGVLPQVVATIRELPPRVVLPTDLGVALLAELPPGVLDLGRAAVGQLDTVVGTSADVAGLTATQRAALFAWVDQGGRLLLDDPTQLDAVPEVWRPGAEGYSFAGAGEIRLVDGAAGAGAWDEILEPSRLAQEDSIFGSSGETGFDPSASLARRAGVSIPDLGPLLIGLAAYVVLVGPVLYLVLRRLGRLTAGWIVVPALAVVTAAVVVVIGGSWQRSGRPSASVFVETSPAGATASTLLLSFARGGGEVEVAVPEGWGPANTSQFTQDQRTLRTFTTGGSGATIGATLEPGQIALMETAGAATDAGIVVEAAVTGRREVSGTVRNESGRDLLSVTVFAPDRARVLGPLAAGGSLEFTLDDVAPAPTPGRGLIFEVWSDPEIGFGNPFGTEPTPAVDIGLWSAMSGRSVDGLYGAALVRAVGWTDERPSEMAADAVTRTAFTSVAAITDGEGPLSPLAVRTTLTSPQPFGFAEEQTIVYRFAVPPGTTPGPLVLDDLPNLDDVEALVGGEWVELDRDGGEYDVPFDHLDQGVLVVRGQLDANRFGFDPGISPTLSGAAS